jgi:hypothetical protein
MNRTLGFSIAVAACFAATMAHGAIITGWAVHNGSSTVGGTAAAPTFTAADNLTLMAPFTSVALTDNGHYVEVSTTLEIVSRTGSTGVNGLNTQLRAGLFNGPPSAVAMNDVPNLGFTIEYSNAVAGGLMREQTSVSQVNPFTGPTSLGNGAQDAGAHSIQGANPGPVTFALRLTRNAGALDLMGSISGNDSVAGEPYLATFTQNGISASNFSFNRIGLFLGPNVDGGSATLTNSTVTTNIPEPTGAALLVVSMAALAVSRREMRGAGKR